jgi:polar amino acid transport system substrate-binding protein
MKKVFLLYLAGLLVLSCGDSKDDATQWIDEAAAIHYFTENYPPFNYEQETLLYGVSVDILDALFEKLEIPLNREDVMLKTWSEGYNTVLNTSQTALFSMVRAPERESLFKWVGPIAPHKDVLIAKKSAAIAIGTASDIPNYKIAVIRDYSNVQLLLDAGIPQNELIIAENSSELYTFLENDSADCIAFTEIAHPLMVQALGLNEADFDLVYTLKVEELYYAFNKNVSDGLINFLNDGLENLQNDKADDGSSVYEKILSSYNVINQSNDGITEAQVIALVELTAEHIEADAAGTFAKMNASEAPYLDAQKPALYSFVYDTALTMVGHAANHLLVNRNFKGKTDAAGKAFRDFILAGALANGSGWEDYIYTKPGEGGLYYKTTYYQLTDGSDGKKYIVCSGKYK